jgi:hypothetical protein
MSATGNRQQARSKIAEFFTVTKDPVQLVLVEKREPVDAFLLVFAQLGFNLHRNLMGVQLTAIEQLCEELSLVVTMLQ